MLYQVNFPKKKENEKLKKTVCKIYKAIFDYKQ